MGKRPSFQFYPADWSASPNLKRCTFAEKGIWLEVMCLLHDQEEYGVLRWTLQEIATAVKCRVAELRSLHRKGVIKGDDQALAEAFVYVPRSGRKDGPAVTIIPIQAGPIWFSSRMVKDEYVRVLRGEGGATPSAPKPTPKGPPETAPKGTIGAAFGPRGSSSSSSSPSSEGSGTNVPADPNGSAWAMAVGLLTRTGEMTEAAARAFFGKLLATHKLEAREMLGTMGQAINLQTQDPKGYLTKAAQSVAARKAADKTPKRVGFV